MSLLHSARLVLMIGAGVFISILPRQPRPAVAGRIYQHVELGKRCDIPAGECETHPLKYKITGKIAA